MKKNILFLFLTINICSKAQLINVNPVSVKIGPNNFTSEVIKMNKIKRIEINVTNKPDGAIIIDKGTGYGYEFNTAGLITEHYRTVFNKILIEGPIPSENKKKQKHPPVKQNKTNYINDTVYTRVFYDSVNNLVCKRIKTDANYDGYYYEYNKENELTKEVHFKETNISEDKNEFKIGSQKLLFAETYEYKTLTPKQTKKKCLNADGYAYKNILLNYDDKKLLVSETHEFTVSWLRQEYNYQYDSASRLVKKTYKSNENGSLKLEWVYEYGKNNNVLSEKKYKNDELIFETNYLFDEQDVLVKSEVNRDHKNASVIIVKYAYTFYP